MKLKAKELRKKSIEELLKTLYDMNREISRWKAGQSIGGIGGNLPSTARGTIRWGLFRTLKRDKATILMILNERGIKI